LVSSASRFSTYIAIPRSMTGRIRETDLDNIRMIASHLRRAYRLSDLVVDLRQQQNSLSDAFNCLSVGLIFADGEGRIIHSNEAATRLLDEGTAARRCRDRISALSPKAARQLREALSAAQSPAASGPEFRTTVLLPGLEGEGKDLIAWLMPLTSSLRSRFSTGRDARFAIVLKHAEEAVALPDAAFVRHHELTEGETRLLTLLMQGMNLVESAAACDLSYNTMKTHLRNLFRKTGATRQAELVNMASAFSLPMLERDLRIGPSSGLREILAPRSQPAGLLDAPGHRYKHAS
jgi:DNA-binding CsgD family transcriptional regulator